MLGLVLWVRVWKLVMEGGGAERSWWRVVKERVCIRACVCPCLWVSASVGLCVFAPVSAWGEEGGVGWWSSVEAGGGGKVVELWVGKAQQI